MTTINLAIADDHKLFRQGIINILKTYSSFNMIIEAESCKQLMAAMEVQLPDIVLIDIEMPEMDGIEGCKAILQQYPEMKIIALSMHTADNFIFHMMKVGARSYLHKDIDQDSLKHAIEEVAFKGFYFTERIAEAMLRGVKSKSMQKPILKGNQITSREKEVLLMICQGFTNSEIAARLFLSVRTVEGHRQHLLEKTGTTNSVSLAVLSIKTGLVSTDDLGGNVSQ